MIRTILLIVLIILIAYLISLPFSDEVNAPYTGRISTDCGISYEKLEKPIYDIFFAKRWADRILSQPEINTVTIFDGDVPYLSKKTEPCSLNGVWIYVQLTSY